MLSKPLTLISALTLAPLAWSQALLTNQHVDLNIHFSGGTAQSAWSMGARDDDDDIEYAPNQCILRVGSAARTARNSSPSFDFIGVPAGKLYWRLPQLQNPVLLYLGFAGYGVGFSSIASYDATAESGGRVSGNGPWVKVTLMQVRTKVRGGQFSVWQTGDTGPVVFMATSDGITSNDALWIVAGGHIHYNWGFTTPGDYFVTFKTSAYLPDGQGGKGQAVESSPITFHYVVSPLAIGPQL